MSMALFLIVRLVWRLTMNDSPLTSDVVAIYLEINKVFNNWCLFFLLVNFTPIEN